MIDHRIRVDHNIGIPDDPTTDRSSIAPVQTSAVHFRVRRLQMEPQY